MNAPAASWWPFSAAKTNAPKVNGSNAPKVNGFNAPKVNGSNAPKVNGMNAPKVNGSNAPKMNAPLSGGRRTLRKKNRSRRKGLKRSRANRR